MEAFCIIISSEFVTFRIRFKKCLFIYNVYFYDTVKL